MAFKFFKGNETPIYYLSTYPYDYTLLGRQNFTNDVEFCFQFDDEEPVIIGNGPNNLQINISPTPDGNMTFNDNGRVFKIFAREREQ